MSKCPFCDKEIDIDSLSCIHCWEDFKEFMTHDISDLIAKWKIIKQRDVLVWVQQTFLSFIFWWVIALLPIGVFYYFGGLIADNLPFFSTAIFWLLLLIFLYAMRYVLTGVISLIILLFKNETSHFYIKDGRKIKMAELVARLGSFEKLRESTK